MHTGVILRFLSRDENLWRERSYDCPPVELSQILRQLKNCKIPRVARFLLPPRMSQMGTDAFPREREHLRSFVQFAAENFRISFCTGILVARGTQFFKQREPLIADFFNGQLL